MRLCIVTLVGAALAVGCTTPIDVKLTELKIRNQVIEASKEVVACTDQLRANPQYARLYEKVTLDYKPPATPAQLSDTDVPTNADIQLAMKWFAERQSCSAHSVENFGRIDPELGVYMANTERTVVALYSDIITNPPSFSVINSRLTRMRAVQQAEIRQWAHGLDAKLKALHDQQVATAAEEHRQFVATVGIITQVAADVLVASVQALAAQQQALAAAQTRYVVLTPAYRAVTITNTTCGYFGGLLQCHQVSY